VTSERSEVLMQKLFNKIKVFVCCARDFRD